MPPASRCLSTSFYLSLIQLSLLFRCLCIPPFATFLRFRSISPHSFLPSVSPFPILPPLYPFPFRLSSLCSFSSSPPFSLPLAVSTLFFPHFVISLPSPLLFLACKSFTLQISRLLTVSTISFRQKLRLSVQHQRVQPFFYLFVLFIWGV